MSGHVPDDTERYQSSWRVIWKPTYNDVTDHNRPKILHPTLSQKIDYHKKNFYQVDKNKTTSTPLAPIIIKSNTIINAQRTDMLIPVRNVLTSIAKCLQSNVVPSGGGRSNDNDSIKNFFHDETKNISPTLLACFCFYQPGGGVISNNVNQAQPTNVRMQAIQQTITGCSNKLFQDIGDNAMVALFSKKPDAETVKMDDCVSNFL